MPTEETMVEGLRVVLARKPGLPLAAWGVQFGSGSAQELKGEEGYAHFLEHMVYKGSAGLSAAALTRSLDGRGLSPNAATGTRGTCFFIDGLLGPVMEGAVLLGGAVTAPAMRLDDLDIERGVVLSEFDAGESDPELILQDAIQRQAFAGHPQERDIIGLRESVLAAVPGDLMAFHARHYSRGNAVMVVVGDMDIGEAEAVCIGSLAGLPGGATPPSLPPLPAPSGSEGHTPLPVPARNAVLYARLGLPPDTARDTARRVLGSYLGGGLSSPLMSRLREELGIVYRIGSCGGRDGGDAMFSVEWTARAEDEAMVRSVISEELRRVADGGVDADLLAGTLLRSRVARARASFNPSALLQRVLHDLEETGQAQGEEERAAAIEGVTAEAISREAEAILASPACFHAVGPEL